MKHKDGKPGSQHDRKLRIVPTTLLLVVLCSLSFYLGGIFCSEKHKFVAKKDVKEVAVPVKAGPAPKETTVAPLSLKFVEFPKCSIEYQDYTPCTDPRVFDCCQISYRYSCMTVFRWSAKKQLGKKCLLEELSNRVFVKFSNQISLNIGSDGPLGSFMSQRWRKYGMNRFTFMERHCPSMHERKECLVPPPEGYKLPIRWPKSRDECWYRNVPYNWINQEKSNQNWLRKQGEKFLFPGGGTMFPNGVSAYVDLMQALIPGMKDGTVRTAIDTGCGVASWGGDLLDHGILTVSLAPRDNHEAQVQFALERGIPAILGIISTQRLPFPSNSFDMAHCSRCLIPWTEFGGVYLLEIHRILRPGGFWVLSGPPINYQKHWRGWNTTVESLKSDYNKLQKLLTSMCFKLYNKKEDIAVWQKTSNGSCYNQLSKPDAYPPKCDDSLEPDSAWYSPLRPCVVVPNPKLKKLAVKSVPKWPERLHVAPERISEIHGSSAGAFKHDNSKWKVRVTHYKKLLPAIGTDKIRNVMDMNAVYGSFAAALIKDPVWVMNVVSSYATNTLAVIYDRGLIGTVHDWCEPFSTYPRTYDLLHLDGLFTDEGHRCDMKLVLLEMDRILRPNGYVIIRESSYFINAIATIAKGMRWGCQKEETEYNIEKEKLLICKKKLWYVSDSTAREDTVE